MPAPPDRRLLLALDTATTQAGAALYDGDLVAELSWPAGRHGTRSVLVEVAHLLSLTGRVPADLTALAVSLGPGSFTALRVGLSVVKGLAYALQSPVFGIPTLDVAAYPHRHAGTPVWSVLNAGRARVVAARYAMTERGWRATSQPLFGPVAEFAAQVTGPALVCGEVSPALEGLLAGVPGVTVLPPSVRARRPGHLAELAWERLRTGQPDDPITLEPIYLETTGVAGAD